MDWKSAPLVAARLRGSEGLIPGRPEAEFGIGDRCRVLRWKCAGVETVELSDPGKFVDNTGSRRRIFYKFDTFDTFCSGFFGELILAE